jgi:putative spermidine/putrescine transport system substrate-binding protein
MSRRILLWSLPAAVLALVTGAIWWLTRPLPVLTVTTWPGAYARAQAIAMLRPYGEAKRVDVRIAEYDGGLDHLRSEIVTRRYDWDVVDFELDDAVAACRANLLEPIDPRALSPGANGMASGNDFVRGAIGRCWVGSVVFSQVVAYAPGRFSGREPRTLPDFFDTRHYPGRRALRRSSPKLNLELALLGDGAKANDVYRLLSTPAGVSRALAVLSKLRGSIVWWTRSSEPIEMLRDGRAAFATALNGTVYDAEIHGDRVGVIWDRELYEFDAFAVPRGDPRRQRAMDFIRYATQTEPLAHAAQWVPYGPARRSSVPLVGGNPEFGIAMQPHLPTAPENFSTAFAVDDEWWLLHKAEIDRRWRQWLHEDHATLQPH